MWLVPPLRFPEFTKEWKKKALGDIGEAIIGLTYSPFDVVPSDGTIVFRSSNIQDGQIDYSDLVRVSKNIKEKIITLENDILVCARNGSARLIGKNAILKQSDAGNTFGAFMMVYRSSDNPFIHPMLSTRRYFRQVGENLGARINQITTSDFNGFEFFFPRDEAERRKIAKIFSLLDERIATQNKIIDKLQSLIKGIRDYVLNNKLQDSTRKKLGELCSITTGKLDANAMKAEGLYPFFTCAEEVYKIDNFAFDTEALLISGNGANLGYIHYYKGKFNVYQRTYVLSDFIEDVHYIQIYLEAYLHKRIALEKSTSNTPYIVLATLAEMPIVIPNIKIQKGISSKILLLKSKLMTEIHIRSRYNDMRQFLLSQMFI